MKIITSTALLLLAAPPPSFFKLGFFLLQPVTAMPTWIVESGKAKCLSVEAPQDTVLVISYDAPDLPLDKKDPKYAPTFLTVSVRPANRVTDTKLHSAPILSHLKPKNQILDALQGTVRHTMEVDGRAEVCVRASLAGSDRPMRFGLRVVEHQELLGNFDSEDAAAKSKKNTAQISNHLSHMETEIRRIQMGMTRILSEADFAKERDQVFHKQTQSMHSATIFWPIVQVCVLIMTGFTQASHIVRFFQSRRII